MEVLLRVVVEPFLVLESKERIKLLLRSHEALIIISPASEKLRDAECKRSIITTRRRVAMSLPFINSHIGEFSFESQSYWRRASRGLASRSCDPAKAV